jgi:lipoate-protein ligase A
MPPAADPPGLAIGDYRRDEDLIARALAGEPAMRVGGVEERCIVLGSGSDAAVELDLDACRDDDFPVLRRRGGGCAVVLDPGNLIVAAALPLPGVGRIHWAFEQLSAWLLAGLARAGVPDAQREEVSDIALGDRKIGGASIWRGRDVLLYGCTLLVDPEVRLSERYLRHPPREPAYRRGRDHRAFMGSLREMAGVAEPAAFGEAMRAGLGALPVA